MASIRDVAKKANVGPTTVSRVLNNSGYVSDETRQKIEWKRGGKQTAQISEPSP